MYVWTGKRFCNISYGLQLDKFKRC